MSRDMAYLLDILLRAKDVVSFTKQMDRHAFLSDRKCQYAVIRCFEVIGEAAKRLSEDFQREYLEVKAQDTQRDRTKREFLDEWVRAVNEHGGFGKWNWAVSTHPSDVSGILQEAVLK